MKTMTKNEIQKLDGDKIMNTYARFDLVIDHGKGSRCVDVDGKEYIDFTSGIGVNCLGYCDEGWVAAVTEQAAKLQHCSNLFFSQPQVEVAENLTARTGLKKVFFGNSGAEANEAAIKTARKYGTTKKGENCNKIISLVNSFHGRTMATITATGQEHYHQYFTPFLDGFLYCPANDIEALKGLVSDDVCAIMLEMVQGEGGVLDLDFLRNALDNVSAPVIFAGFMLVNNETGAVYDVKSAAALVRAKFPDAVLHCDAVQGYLKLKKSGFSPYALGVDTMTLSGHKVHAVRGAGARATIR